MAWLLDRSKKWVGIPPSLRDGLVLATDLNKGIPPGGINADNQVSALWDMSAQYQAVNNPSHPLSQSTGSQMPFLSRADNKGNLTPKSEDLTESVWLTTDVTVNDETTFTVDAQNGFLSNAFLSREGVTYRLRFRARAVSGNTSLVYVHINSASGDAAALTLTGTLTEYTTTFLGRIGGGAVAIGIGDINASGFGQIEMTEVSVIEVGWDSDYITNNTANPIYPGINSHRLMHFDGIDDVIKGGFTLNLPISFFLVIKILSDDGFEYLFDGSSDNRGLQTGAGGANRLRLYYGTNGGPEVDTTLNQWAVVSAVVNGTSSLLQWNNETVSSGTTPGTNNPGGVTLGGRGTSTNLDGHCQIADCLVYNRALTETERTSVKDFLITKYGIS